MESMFLNINGTEFLILVVVALIVIGPSRMPEYAQKLRDLVRTLRSKAEDAKRSVQEDFGDDFKDVDWRKLDPRQYDPRRIVREALQEDPQQSDATHIDDAGSHTDTAANPLQRYAVQAQLRDRTQPAPYDDEAT